MRLLIPSIAAILRQVTKPLRPRKLAKRILARDVRRHVGGPGARAEPCVKSIVKRRNETYCDLREQARQAHAGQKQKYRHQ